MGGYVPFFTLFIASTRTSTIPGVSIAGPTPEATLYTPALDAEIVVAGRPLSLNVVPVSPEGVPTPAIVSRALLERLGAARLVVDAGSSVEPRVPHARLPSRVVGERVDSGRALPRGRAERLFSEARLLASSLGGGFHFIVGESMPGGTTTAMSIMEALGFKARGRVSSASPRNPHDLKARLYEAGVRFAGLKVPVSDPFIAVEAVGDPLHVSIAGFVVGAVEAGSRVTLAGGTQMCSVLAILRGLGYRLDSRVRIATTRWIVEDPSSDFMGLVREIAQDVEVKVAPIDFSGSRFDGLRLYEEGYVKEGVGMGGLMIAALEAGLTPEDILEAVEGEYERVVGVGGEGGRGGGG